MWVSQVSQLSFERAGGSEARREGDHKGIAKKKKNAHLKTKQNKQPSTCHDLQPDKRAHLHVSGLSISNFSFKNKILSVTTKCMKHITDRTSTKSVNYAAE